MERRVRQMTSLLLQILSVATWISCTSAAAGDIDIKVTNLEYQLSGAKIFQDKTSTVRFTITAINDPEGDTPTPIPAASAGQFNYEVEWKISDKHLSVGNSGISPPQTIPSSAISINTADKVKLSQLISDGGSISVSGEVTFTIPNLVCTSVTHICLFLNQVNDAFNETIKTNNYGCINVTDSNMIECNNNWVDLSFVEYHVSNPVVDAGGFADISLRIEAQLSGTKTLQPTTSPADAYVISAYLTKEKSLTSGSIKQLTVLPNQFGKVSQSFMNAGSNYLTLSGPGLHIPELHQNMADHKFCGSVYLAILLDGPMNPGNIPEPDEWGNVMYYPITILCPGDKLMLNDFSFALGTFEEQLFIGTDTPLSVNATVCNVDKTRTHLDFGRAHFALKIYLSTSGVFTTGTKIDVTRKGIKYSDSSSTPYQAMPVGSCVTMLNTEIWVDGAKFTENSNTYSNIILVAEMPGASMLTDDIFENNAMALPVSTSTKTNLVDYRMAPATHPTDSNLAFGIRQTRLKVGTVPESHLDNNRDPIPNMDTFSLTGEPFNDQATNIQFAIILYWSVDNKYDAELDLQSTIILKMIDSNQEKRLVADPTSNVNFTALSQPNLCGNIYAIVYLTQAIDVEFKDEKTKHNNFGVDTITLQCHENDTLGLTQAEVIDAPVLWKGVMTPVTVRAIVSCTMDNCSPLDGTGAVHFQFEISLDDDMSGDGVNTLKTIASNNDLTECHSPSNCLNSDLNDASAGNTGRAEFTMTFEVAAPGDSNCAEANRYLKLKLLKADGTDDGWTDNDNYWIKIPPPKCSTVSTIDIAAGSIDLPGAGLNVGQYHPFTLCGTISPVGTTLVQSDWPHFFISFYLSLDNVLDENDYLIQYELTSCQVYVLSAKYTAGSTLTLKLDDMYGFYLPQFGLERFCDVDGSPNTHDVYVLAKFDSYDMDPSDGIKGQMDETREANNVAVATQYPITGLVCSGVVDITQNPKLSVSVRKITGMEPFPLIWQETDRSYAVEVVVTNSYKEAITGGASGNADFDIHLRISDDQTYDTSDVVLFKQNVSSGESLYWDGIEAGDSVLINISASLCAAVSGDCVADNVFEAGDCDAFTVNGWTGAHVVANLTDIRAEIAGNGYMPVSAEAFKVLPMCKTGILAPEIVSVQFPSTIYQGVTYDFPFEIKVYHFQRDGTLLQMNTNNPNFNVQLVLSADGTSAVKTILANTTEVTGLQEASIPIDGYITVKGKVTGGALTHVECTSLRTGSHAIVQLTGLHAGLQSNFEIGWADKIHVPTSTVAYVCSNNNVDIGITTFHLKDDTDASEDNTVVIGTKKAFDLVVDIVAKSPTLGNGSARSYEPVFGLTTDPSVDPTDNLPSPFADASAQDTELKKSVTSNTQSNQDLSSTATPALRTDWLEFDASKTGKFCGEPDVYLVVKIDNRFGSPAPNDPENRNDRLVKKINFQCDRDLLKIKSATGLPGTYFASSAFPLSLTLEIMNTHPDMITIPAGDLGEDNFFIEIHNTVSGTDGKFDFSSVSFSDESVLTKSLAPGEAVTITYDVTLNIPAASCTNLEFVWVQLFGGPGLRVGLIDGVVENNQIKVAANCSPGKKDVTISAFSLASFPSESTLAVNYDFTADFDMQGYTGGDVSTPLEFKFWLSHDGSLDTAQDFDVGYTPGHTSLSGPFTDDSPNTIVLNHDSTGGSPVTFPGSVVRDYCGRSHLLVQVDSSSTITESNELNNVHDEEFFMKCDGDQYDLENVVFHSTQSVIYRNKPVTFAFSADVYNVKPNEHNIPAPASGGNFALKLYAQKGAVYSTTEAVDLTPAAWTFSNPTDANKFAQNHNFGKALSFKWFKTEVMHTNSLCDMEVDHLILAVEGINPQSTSSECVRYNNYYSHPIQCGGPDSTDIRVKLDRNNLPEFTLDFDNNIVLGMPKLLHLEVEVDVSGVGGWMMRSAEDPAPFMYKVELVSGNDVVVVDMPDKTMVINQAVTQTTVLTLGGQIVLSNGTFLKYCDQSGLRLRVTLDTLNDILESNELNNVAYIDISSLTDGGAGFCSGMTDVGVDAFGLRPVYTKKIKATENPATNTDFTFTYTIHGPIPASIKHKLYMSADGNSSNPDNKELRDTLKTITSPTQTATVDETSTIHISLTEDTHIEEFCGSSTFLGIYVFTDGAEVGLDNNYAWINVLFECPETTAVSLIQFDLEGSTVIRDGSSNNLIFNTSVINKGIAVPTGTSNNFDFQLYLSDTDSLEGVGASQLTTTFGNIDVPNRMNTMLPLDIFKYQMATAQFSVNPTDCIAKTHFCLKLEIALALDTWLKDNYVCVKLNEGQVSLDCSRDIQLSAFSASPIGVSNIYQDTLVPMSVQFNISFLGRMIGAAESNQLSFDYSLSDRNDVTPTAVGGPLSQSTMFTSTSDTTLRGAQTSGANYMVEGTTDIQITNTQCAQSSRYLCVRYVFKTVLSPAFRDETAANDWQCTIINTILQCNDNTRDIAATWFDIWNRNIFLDKQVHFDLQVSVEMRGTETGQVRFQSGLYVKNSAGSLYEIPYTGFQYGVSASEMKRMLTSGLHTFNMADRDIPFTIPSTLPPEYCGDGMVVFRADKTSTVNERYENNNEFEIPVTIHCPNDTLKIRKVDIELPDKLQAKRKFYATITYEVQALVKDRPGPSLSVPMYTIRVYPSSSEAMPDPATDIALNWQLSGSKEYFMPLRTTMPNQIKDLKVSLGGATFTQSLCSSTTHLVVCIEDLVETESKMDNNCEAVKIEDDQKMCSDSAGDRDIIAQSFTLPYLLTLPQTVDIIHSLRVITGASAAPIASKGFTSGLYLSKDSKFDWSDLRLGNVPNNIAVPANKDKWFQELSTVALPGVSEEYYGKMYAFLVADSEKDIVEPNSMNNIIRRDVVIIGANDSFGLSDVEYEGPDFLPVSQAEIRLHFGVTCTKTSCNLPHNQNNVRFTLTAAPSGANVQLLDTNDMGSISMKPSSGIGFRSQGYTQWFDIIAPVTLGNTACGADGKVELKLEVHPGSALSGQTDGVLANNVHTWNVTCKMEGTRDLIAESIMILSGPKLKTGEKYRFTTNVSLTGSALPVVDGAPPVTDFTFSLYVSDDMRLSDEDVKLQYHLSKVAGADLAKGIPADGTRAVYEIVEGALIPEGAGGKKYILIQVDDTSRISESSEDNNVAATMVWIESDHDLVLTEDTMDDHTPPSYGAHQDREFIMKFNLMVRNVAKKRLTAKGMNMLPFKIGALFSRDDRLDYLTDVMVDDSKISLSGETMASLRNGIEMNGMLEISGNVMVTVDAANCAQYSHVLVAVMPWVGIPHADSFIVNDFTALPLNVKCKAGVDLALTEVSIQGAPDVVLGTTKSLTLSLSVKASASDTVEGFAYRMFLSTDTKFDLLDYPLDMNTMRYDTSVTSDSNLNLNVADVPFPVDLPVKYCGESYILAVVDIYDEVIEYDESNNVVVATNTFQAPSPFRIKCDNNVFTMKNFEIGSSFDGSGNVVAMTTPILFSAQTPVAFSMAVKCHGGNDGITACPGSNANEPHFTFNLWVADRNEQKLADASPSALNPTIVTPTAGTFGHGFNSIQEINFKFAQTVEITDQQTCNQVEKLCLEMVTGTSTEMAGKQVGPQAANIRCHNIQVECSGATIDLEIVDFSQPSGGQGITMTTPDRRDPDRNMTFNLNVRVNAQNWPENTQKRPVFNFDLYLSADDTITTDDVRFGHVPSDAVMQSLKVSLANGASTFPLGEVTDIESIAGDLYKYCNIEGMHLGIILDPFNEVAETNENNNVAAIPLTINDCGGISPTTSQSLSAERLAALEATRGQGFNLQIKNLESPSVTKSGDSVALGLDMSVTLIGDVGFPQATGSDLNVNMTFWLLEDTDNMDDKYYVDVDLTPINAELTKAYQAADAVLTGQTKGIATVLSEDLAAMPNLLIPADYMFCDKSWLLGVNVAFGNHIPFSEIYLKDNWAFHHIHIACPEDKLAIHSVDVSFLPDVLWSESTNRVDFTVSVLNQANQDIPIPNLQDNSYSIEIYFSKDNIFNEATDGPALQVLDPGGYPYTHRAAVPAKSVVTSPKLTGDLRISTFALCEEAKSSSGKPTLFFRLKPTDLADSAFTGNDVYGLRLNKNTLKCDQANVDLGVYSIKVAGLRGNITLHANTQFNFSFTIRHRKSSFGLIDQADLNKPDERSFVVQSYLSTDKYYSADDEIIEFEQTQDQKNTQRQGIGANTAEFIVFAGNNMRIDMKQKPAFQLYCGKGYFVVRVVDMKNINPRIDPVPWNDFLAVPLKLKCPEDAISVDMVDIHPVFPQTMLYYSKDDQPFKTKFQLNLEVTNRATKDISFSARPNVNFRMFVSPDETLDLRTDPELEITLSDDLVQQSKRGIKAGETAHYDGYLDVILPFGHCPFQLRYLIVFAQRGANLNIDEETLYNNYLPVNVEHVINCTLKRHDLDILNFEITNGNEFSRGQRIEYLLRIELKQEGGAFLGIVNEFSEWQKAFEYQFFLSKTPNVDNASIDLGYSGNDYRGLLYAPLAASYFFNLNSASEPLLIPGDWDIGFCGSAYVVALLDHRYKVYEWNERNNMAAIPINLQCHDKLFELIKPVTLILQDTYFKAKGHIDLKYSVRNVAGQNFSTEMTADGKLSLVELKMYVKGMGKDAIEHDITPAAGYTNQLEETVIMGDDFYYGEIKEYAGLKALIDITPACHADVGQLVTGKATLVFEIVPGKHSRVKGRHDSNRENRIYETSINVNCGSDTIDLVSSESSKFCFTPCGAAVPNLVFGNNPFNLVVNATIEGSGGWDTHPSGPTDPAKFEYNFQMIVQISQYVTVGETQVIQVNNLVLPIAYNMSNVKSRINSQTLGTRYIDLSSNLVLPRKDFLVTCLTTLKIPVTLTITPGPEVVETNLGNNLATADLEPQDQDSAFCSGQDSKDYSVATWQINNVMRDLFEPGKTYAYTLEAQVILAGALDEAPKIGDLTHFAVTFVLSMDKIRDDKDYNLQFDLSAAQKKKLQDYLATGFHKVDLSGDMVIALTNYTYAYCWKHVFVGVLLDYPEAIGQSNDEANEENNDAWFHIIYDCKDAVDECRSGFHNCDSNADCTDLPYELYTVNAEPFSCKCKPGYLGNGTYCEDINECTTTYVDSNGATKKMHNCDTIDQASCENTVGSFECTCGDGFIKGRGSEGQDICTNINECVTGAHNCHTNADCTDYPLNGQLKFTCACKPGFSGNGTYCVNVDDCVANSCLNNGTCEDDINGVICHCKKHYFGDNCQIADGNWGQWGSWEACVADCGDSIQYRHRQCNDPAPTSEGRNCPQDQGTEEESRACDENSGQGTRTCTAVTESWCEGDPCGKANGGICFMTNNGASFECRCQTGFEAVFKTMNGKQEFQRCDDKNECADATLNDCDRLATCTNRAFGFTCTCKDGYSGSGRVCEDINECATGGGAQCHVNADCENFGGGYRCNCKTGFKREKVGDSNTGTCVLEKLINYGAAAGDIPVTTKTSLTDELVSDVVIFPHGLPVYDGQILNGVYFSENGIAAGVSSVMNDGRLQSLPTPEDLSKVKLEENDQVKAIIAALWTNGVVKDGVSEMWYKSYADTKDEIFTWVKSMLSKTLGLQDFKPGFIVKCTWHKMRPHYVAEADQVNTFQLMIVTDYVNSYAITVYDDENLRWTPVYSDADLVKYQGYPARIGYVNRKPNGMMYFDQNKHSGKWSTDTDPSALNAYRVDSKLMQSHSERGVYVVRLDNSNANPRQACVFWYHDEPPISEWGANLVGQCPGYEGQAQSDRKFKMESSSGGRSCFSLIFPTSNGASIRCCYKTSDGSLITEKNTQKARTVSSYSEAGFISRYATNAAMHQSQDVEMYQKCCIESRPYGDEYCQYYLERRPMSSSSNYDEMRPAIGHGDPHFSTIDGNSYTFNGFGEFVCLRSKVNAPLFLMVQCRTQFVPPVVTNPNGPTAAEPEATQISAIAIQVGSSTATSWQMYLVQDGTFAGLELDVYRDNTQVAGNSQTLSDVEFKRIGSSVRLVFAAGIWIECTPQSGMMKLTFGVPSSLLTGHYQGLWGNLNGNPADDYVFASDNLQALPQDSSQDDVFHWGQTWSLRQVYGVNTNGGGTNANIESRFKMYTNSYTPADTVCDCNDAITYFKVGFTPFVFTSIVQYTTAIQEACREAVGSAPNQECMYDYKVTGNQEVGLRTLNNVKEFRDLRVKLGNDPPVFTMAPDVIQVAVGDQVRETIQVTDKDGKPDKLVNIKVEFIDETGAITSSNELETTNVNGSEYNGQWTWNPAERKVYGIRFVAEDSEGAIVTHEPKIVLCGCENSGVCDYHALVQHAPGGSNVVAGFLYAGCKCKAGRSGKFCEDEFPGCGQQNCYSTCADLLATQVAASISKKEYTCTACPSGTDDTSGNGQSCTAINECNRPTGDPLRHQCDQICRDKADGYTCACRTGFQLNTDGKTCIDVKECDAQVLNDCTQKNARCEEDPNGGYKCVCGAGFNMDKSGVCVDLDECAVTTGVEENGGCQQSCINSVGSYSCGCHQGYAVSASNPKLCTEINECTLNPKCDADQVCVDAVGYYRCECDSTYFFKHPDTGKCEAITQCSPDYVCQGGSKCAKVKGVNTCFCPHGYQLDPSDPKKCVDSDECSQKTHQCVNADCVNLPETYNCTCKPGYRTNQYDHKKCEDIDECKGTHGCTHVCTNNEGSYQCSCKDGYTLAQDGKTCNDINECIANGGTNQCDVNADCNNLNGTYECKCRTGYVGPSGFLCNDDNECAKIIDGKNGGCDHVCHNTFGSFHCSCREGFELDPSDSKGLACRGINSCINPANPCTHGCTDGNSFNTPYTCTCPTGFVLDPNGYKCNPTSPCEDDCGVGGTCRIDGSGNKACSCYNGYQKGSRSLDECKDVDECADGTRNWCEIQSDPQVSCVNEVGTYRCACKAGYELNDNGVACRDINECNLTPAKCDGQTSDCINKVGSYNCVCKGGFIKADNGTCIPDHKCNTLDHNCHDDAMCADRPGGYSCKCKQGYQGDGIHCQDVDECGDPSKENCDPVTQNCLNVKGNFTCDCKTGYMWDYTTNKCVDINECASPVLNKCDYACTNLPGSYKCTCYSGSVLNKDGRTCTVINKCTDSSTCSGFCVKQGTLDVCRCDYPLDENCKDVNECLRQVAPCRTNSHSKCVNKNALTASAGFVCECDKPYEPDADGLGCTETNGLWSSWAPWTACSRTCYGRQKHNRLCNSPPPEGFMRMCPGLASEYRMCNNNAGNCTVDSEQIADGVSLTFPGVPNIRWEDAEAAVFEAVAGVVNIYCRERNETYKVVCGGNPPASGIPVGKCVIPSDIKLAKTYPQPSLDNGTEVVIGVKVREDSEVCGPAVKASSRKKRAADPAQNSTSIPQDILLIIINLNHTQPAVTAQVRRYRIRDLQDFMQFIAKAAHEPVTTAAPTVAADEGDGGLAVWLIVVIVLACLLFIALIAVVVFFGVVRRGKKKDQEEEETNNSQAELPKHEYTNRTPPPSSSMKSETKSRQDYAPEPISITGAMDLPNEEEEAPVKRRKNKGPRSSAKLSDSGSATPPKSESATPPKSDSATPPPNEADREMSPVGS